MIRLHGKSGDRRCIREKPQPHPQPYLSVFATVADPVKSTNPAEAPWPAPAYSWYVVIVLILAYIVSFVDRQIMTLLVEPIRNDLGLSDTGISLLIGFAFAIFYVLMGVPIARLSDTRNRRNIIAAGIFVWSIMTACCGLAKNFWQLFLARIGVGVGEATLTPAAYSMIADQFPPNRLGRAMGAYTTGLFLGAGLALVLGGVAIGLIENMEAVVLPLLGEVRPWQLTFFIVGLPGLVVLVLVLFTIKEPVRRNQLLTGGKAEPLPVAELLAFLRTNWRTIGCITGAFSFGGVAVVGFLAWAPEFVRRTYGWEIADAGMVFGIELAVLGAIGSFMGGWVNDWLKGKGYKDAALRFALVVFLLLLPLMVITPLMPTAGLALPFMGATAFVISLQQCLSPVAIQLITPNQMRAQVTAVYFLVANFLAIGFGPTSVALVTDYVFGNDADLRYSLSFVTGVSMLLAALFLLLGLKQYRLSLDRSRAWREED